LQELAIKHVLQFLKSKYLAISTI